MLNQVTHICLSFLPLVQVSYNVLWCGTGVVQCGVLQSGGIECRPDVAWYSVVHCGTGVV